MRGNGVRLPVAAAILVGLCVSSIGFAALKAAPTDQPQGSPGAAEKPGEAGAVPQVPAPEEAKLGVLRRVASGELSPEEALEQLEKLYAARKAQAQWISVQMDERGGKDSVRMSIPIALGEWGLKMAAQQGREMLEMTGIANEVRAHGGSIEAALMQKALDMIESPEGAKALGEIIETLRTSPPGHVLFDLTDGNDHVRVQLE